VTALRTDLDRPALRLAGAPEPTATVEAPGGEWIDIGVAATALGCSDGNLRRECKRLARQGLARKHRPAGERNARWQLNRKYHPQLAKLQGAAAVAPDDSPTKALMLASAAQRDEAARRASIVAAFRVWRRQPGVRVQQDYPAWAESQSRTRGSMPSLGTIYRWNDAAPSEGDMRAVAAALLDGRGGNGGESTLGDEAWAFFKGIYLTTNKITVAAAWRWTRSHADAMRAQGEAGWEWPSQRHVARLVKERISPSMLSLAREGEDAWAKKHQRPLEQHPDAWAAGERWDADHSRFDFFIRVLRGGVWKAERPWLTCWLDWRTRRVMGWRVTTNPDAQSVRTSLLHALRRGVSPPRIAWLDNGKDFASAEITGTTKKQRRELPSARSISRLGAAHTCDGATMLGLLGLLGVEPHFAQPYNHNGKSRIERFFRTMHENFCQTQASWCGSRPGDRDRDAIDRAVADVPSLLTIDELEEKFGAFIAWYNAWPERSVDDLVVDGERLSPDAFYERFLPSVRVLPDPGVLSLLEHRWSRPLAVTKRGVGFRFRGKTVHYGAAHPALDEFRGSGRRVFVTLDPEDVSSVRVYDERMRFVCVAEMNAHFGGSVSTEAVNAAIAERRAAKRRLKERLPVTAILPDVASAAAYKQREMDAANRRPALPPAPGMPAASSEPAPQPSLRIVATPLDGQAERVARAESHRRVRVLVDSTAESVADAIDLNDVEADRLAFEDSTEELDLNASIADVEDDDSEEEFDLTLTDAGGDSGDDIDVLGELSRE